MKQRRNRESLCKLLMKFSARDIHCYDYISLTFHFLSFIVVWFWMRVVCVTAYESTVFIEFRQILSVTSENNEQQNYFLLLCNRLLKYHIGVKCILIYLPNFVLHVSENVHIVHCYMAWQSTNVYIQTPASLIMMVQYLITLFLYVIVQYFIMLSLS